MRLLLLLFIFIPFAQVQAQSAQVTHLPSGTYHMESNGSFKSDIVLIDDSHYKLSNENLVGDYKFSATAQRVLFTSGTLKGAFARTISNSGDPVIVLPHKENEELGFKLVQTDLQAFYKKN